MSKFRRMVNNEEEQAIIRSDLDCLLSWAHPKMHFDTGNGSYHPRTRKTGCTYRLGNRILETTDPEEDLELIMCFLM